MTFDITPAIIIQAATWFIVGFAFLFIVYYFTAPLSARFDDRKSRIIYSVVNALYFAIVLSVGLAIMPLFYDSYGVIVTLLAALVIVVIFTAVQVYVISELVKKGILRMHSKTSGQPKVEPKGKR